MKSCVVLYLLLAIAYGDADEVSNSNVREARLVVIPKTTTTTVTNTIKETSTTVVSTSCGTVAAGLSACRKRRNVIEEPIMINQDVIQAPADAQPYK